LNSTNIVTIHGCGHEFCGDCVKVLRDRCDTYDSEGLGVKVVKCPMCRGTEAVSAEQLKLRVKELLKQRDLLYFETNDLRTKCKNMEKAFGTIRKALPKTRDFNRAQRVAQPVARPVVQPVVQPFMRSVFPSFMQPVAQPVVQPVVQPVAQPVVQPVVQPVARPVVQPVTRPARRGRFGARGQPLGLCGVVGCRSKYRTTRKCDGQCGNFCCARCKKCTDCRHR
jgi:hypothetical protein